MEDLNEDYFWLGFNDPWYPTRAPLDMGMGSLGASNCSIIFCTALLLFIVLNSIVLMVYNRGSDAQTINAEEKNPQYQPLSGT